MLLFERSVVPRWRFDSTSALWLTSSWMLACTILILAYEVRYSMVLLYLVVVMGSLYYALLWSYQGILYSSLVKVSYTPLLEDYIDHIAANGVPHYYPMSAYWKRLGGPEVVRGGIVCT